MYPDNFKEIIKVVLRHEGGYVNDPDDPGGETKFGISRKAYPDLDIAALTEQSATEIYYHDYWCGNKLHKVPVSLQKIFFDMCVNFGRKGAVKVLQEAANGINKKKIEVDGGYGPNTANAIKDLEPDRVRAYRALRFAKLAISRPTLAKYWYGWFKRAISV